MDTCHTGPIPLYTHIVVAENGTAFEMTDTRFDNINQEYGSLDNN